MGLIILLLVVIIINTLTFRSEQIIVDPATPPVFRVEGVRNAN
ncbi:MAG: hypothetical protein R6V75_08040 [Bacteroidales bacterium]